MNVLALVVVALVQLVSLDLQPLRETIEAITTTLVDQYVEPGEGARLVCAVEQRRPSMFRRTTKRAGDVNRRPFVFCLSA